MGQVGLPYFECTFSDLNLPADFECSHCLSQEESPGTWLWHAEGGENHPIHNNPTCIQWIKQKNECPDCRVAVDITNITKAAPRKPTQPLSKDITNITKADPKKPTQPPSKSIVPQMFMETLKYPSILFGVAVGAAKVLDFALEYFLLSQYNIVNPIMGFSVGVYVMANLGNISTFDDSQKRVVFAVSRTAGAVIVPVLFGTFVSSSGLYCAGGMVAGALIASLSGLKVFLL